MIIALFILGTLLVIAFVCVQIWLQDCATIPPRIIKKRLVASSFCFFLCVGASFLVCVVYLAIYFQSVRGVSAVQSGIDTISLFFATSFETIGGGVAVSNFGYFAPFMLGGPPIMAVGAGLLTTFHVHTPASHWIGYQIIFGFGSGICVQKPSVALQRVLSRKDIAIGSALMMFAQQLSGTILSQLHRAFFKTSSCITCRLFLA